MSDKKTDRRPNQDWLEMGLKVGDRLQFKNLPDEIVEVASARKLRWRGHQWFLNRLKVRLKPLLTDSKSLGRVTVNGRNLNEIYLQAYPLATTPTVRPSGQNITLPEAIADSEPYLPNNLTEAREVTLEGIKIRRGRQAFRDALTVAYDGRCAISGCAVLSVLEAAHITSYLGAKTNDVTNGLLLRADLHTLFDLGLLAVDPDTLRLVVASSLKDSEYEPLHGTPLRLPVVTSSQPSQKALKKHFEGWAFASEPL